jgi:hypothetical protein
LLGSGQVHHLCPWDHWHKPAHDDWASILGIGYGVRRIYHHMVHHLLGFRCRDGSAFLCLGKGENSGGEAADRLTAGKTGEIEGQLCKG